MHLVSGRTTKRPEDPGIEVFRESTGSEKQKGTGNDSPANRRNGFKTEKKMIITNEMKFSSLLVTSTPHTMNKELLT